MRKLLLFALLLLSLQSVFSQAGQLDPTWGNGGISTPPPQYIDFDDMAIQPDGKIVAIGTRYVEGPDEEGSYIAHLVRYTTNGKPDGTFSGDGMLTDTYFKPSISRLALAIQKDGKILVVGPSYINTNDPDYAHLYGFAMTRYNTNGTLDTSFGKGGRVFTSVTATGSSANSIAIDSDGKIVVSGICYNDDQTPPYGAVVRYNNNGSVASIQTYYSGFGFEAYPFVATYTTGGYAIMANGSQETNGLYFYSSKFGEKALGLPSNNADGFALINPFIILPDEKIALATINVVAMLNTNGNFNTGFSGDGKLQLNFRPFALAAQKDGKLIIGGSDDNGVTKLERYKTDGTLDFAFSVPMGADGINDIIISDNRMYVLTRHSVVAYRLDDRQRTVKVNLYGNTNPYNNSEWNNWNNLKNLHFNNFYYSDSTASGINAVMSNRNGVNDNGASYGGGMAPAGVLRHSSYAIGSRTVTLSGLATGKKYSIELYGSRNAYSDNSTVYTINGVSKTIATYRNFDSKAVFTNLSPNAQGKIVITISSTKTYNYLNGFVITESGEASASATQATTMVAPREQEKSVLQLNAFPNPSSQSFTLQLKSSNSKPVQLRIVDAAGRTVETRNMASNGSLSLGQAYKPGVYYAELVQNGKRKLLKLVKQAN